MLEIIKTKGKWEQKKKEKEKLPRMKRRINEGEIKIKDDISEREHKLMWVVKKDLMNSQ